MFGGGGRLKMELNPGMSNQSSHVYTCKDCKNEIHRDAKRCHYCGKYQKFRWALLGNLPLILTLIVSVVTIAILLYQVSIARKQTDIANDQVEVAKAQVGVSEKQVEETKKKRIEAEEVLNEARAVKADAESTLLKADDALKKSDSVLTDANTKVDKINKEVNKINRKMIKADKSLNTFTERQKKLSEEVNEIKTELKAEVKKLKERNEIVALADAAITEGATDLYEELMRRSEKLKPNDDLFHIIFSSILRVKQFYSNVNRVKNVDVEIITIDGRRFKNNEATTEQLITVLLKTPQWHVRAKAAQLLKKRKERGVPDALIKGMKDKRLDGRVMCIKSFEALTGFDNPDTLEYNHSIKWWSEHKEEFEKGFQK